MIDRLFFSAIIATGIGLVILLLIELLFTNKFKKSFGVPKMDNPPIPPKEKVLPQPPRISYGKYTKDGFVFKGNLEPRKPTLFCDYCRNIILKSERNCNSCGASNKFYQLIPVTPIKPEFPQDRYMYRGKLISEQEYYEKQLNFMDRINF